MGWKVVVGAALAASALVVLGSATAGSPPGPTSATKALGVIHRVAPHVGFARTAPSSTASTPSNFAIDPTLQLTYHGGPVMHTHTVYLIFWLPSGYQYGSTAGDSTAYEANIEQFVQDVAADNGKTSNAFGAITQYKDAGGPAQYNVTYGGAVVDTNGFPGSHLSPDCPLNDPNGNDTTSFICLTDQDLINEIDNVAQNTLHVSGGLAQQFALILPNTVKTCTDTTNSTCSDNFFCAYHSAYNHGGNTTPFIYLNLPYESDVACHSPDGVNVQPEPHSGNADTTIDDMSHEEREAATDPLGNAWFDANGNEADDKCIDTYGSLVGSNFNQPINGHAYDTQTEWSNAKKGCYQMGAPTVTLEQTSATAGATIGIAGTNFYPPNGQKPVVTFNKTVLDPSAVTVDSPTHLTVTVPSGNVSGKVTVQAIGGTGTSTNSFGVQPFISNIPDNHDFAGTKIEIDGTGFIGVKSVKFNGVAGAFSSVATDGTSLKVVVPTAATTGGVVVQTAGGSSAPVTFTVTPKITSFSPAKGAGLSNVTINGTGLAGTNEVDFNGDASPQIVGTPTATKVVAKVPSDATAGQITVGNGTDTANSAGTFTPLPSIASLNVVDGSPGDSVHILGGPFNCPCSVKFGSTPAAAVTPISVTEVDATVPGAPFSSGKVTLTTTGGSAVSSQTFSITKVASVSPAAAVGGATVTITGQGLASTNEVDFAGSGAPATIVGTPSATTVKVSVPTDTTTVGPLTVKTSNGANVNSASSFKPLPKITGFDKASYEAGCTVTVTGTNLGAGTAKFGTASIGAVASPTATSFQFAIPANAVSSTVSFTNANGTATSVAKVLVKPTITGDPNPNESTVGNKIMIAGQSFVGTTSVTFGADTHKAPFVIGDGGSGPGTLLTVTIPPTAISGPITITNAGGSTQTANPFTLDPVIKSFTPATGPTGTQITVTGTGFVGATGVMFTGGTGGTPTNVTNTSFKVVVPDGTLTGPIQVETNTGGADAYSDPSAAVFTTTLSAALTSPDHADYGTTLSFTGVALNTVTEVDFNGIAGTSLSASVDGQSLQVDVPASGAVTGPITLKAGATTIGAGNFTLLHISGLSRSSALPGSSITITGTGFTGATDVTFGGADSAGFNVDSDTQITVTVPSGETGTLEVVNGGTADAPSTFTIESLTGVVINEVRTDASGFVELYNTNGASRDLTGAKIVFRPAAAADSSTDVVLATIGSTPIGALGFSGDLVSIPSTVGGGIALEYPNGTVVNTMGYGTATNGWVHGTAIAAPAAGHSVGRHPDGTSSGNDSTDFIDETTPTPGAANN